MSKNDPATKGNVEEIVGRVVGEIVGEALQLISDRFDKQDAVLEEHGAILTYHTEQIDKINGSVLGAIAMLAEIKVAIGIRISCRRLKPVSFNLS